MLIDTGTGKDKYQTDPVPEGKPIPVEPEDVEIGDAEYTCTLSISCATILDNMELCNKEKRELVPEDGWILKPMTVTFYEGESVFNILQRTCKQQKIHMEFENTPIYNSAYIEGINNLYEFDVGNTSGWMYKVNGWFPNYGCSRYQLQRRRRHRVGLYLRPRLRRGRRLRNRQRMRNKDAFSGYHPTINFLYFALVLLFSMCLMHPVYLADFSDRCTDL